MPTIHFIRWETGFQKVQFNTLLRQQLGLSLSEAKVIVDTLLEGETISVTTQNVEEAKTLLGRAQTLGVVGEIQ